MSILKSFLKDMNCLFNPVVHNPYANKNPQEADHQAIKSDWEQVGDDIQRDIRKYGEKHND